MHEDAIPSLAAAVVRWGAHYGCYQLPGGGFAAFNISILGCSVAPAWLALVVRILACVQRPLLGSAHGLANIDKVGQQKGHVPQGTHCSYECRRCRTHFACIAPFYIHNPVRSRNNQRRASHGFQLQSLVYLCLDLESNGFWSSQYFEGRTRTYIETIHDKSNILATTHLRNRDGSRSSDERGYSNTRTDPRVDSGTVNHWVESRGILGTTTYCRLKVQMLEPRL